MGALLAVRMASRSKTLVDAIVKPRPQSGPKDQRRIASALFLQESCLVEQ